MTGAHAAPRTPLLPALSRAGGRPLVLAGGALATAAVVSVGVVALDGAGVDAGPEAVERSVVAGQSVQPLGGDLVVAASGRTAAPSRSAGRADAERRTATPASGAREDRDRRGGTDERPSGTATPAPAPGAPAAPTPAPAPAPQPDPAPEAERSEPSPRPTGDAWDGTTDALDGATGGATAPLTGALDEPLQAVTGVVDGVLDPTLGSGGLLR